MTLYEILEVSKNCSSGDIEHAYHMKRAGFAQDGWRGWLVRKLQVTADIDYAYAILSDEEQRLRYDKNPDDFDTFTPLPPTF